MRVTSDVQSYFFIGITRNGDVCYETDGGRIYKSLPKDMFMAPRRVVKWVSLEYAHEEASQFHDSLEFAQQCGACKGKTIARIEWEE